MLVRLKKRGVLPVQHSDSKNPAMRMVLPVFMGCCVEVIPQGTHPLITCGGEWFEVVDARIRPFVDSFPGYVPAICEHDLIDDLNAYDSDSSDEQAEIGDLAMAEVVRTVEVKR